MNIKEYIIRNAIYGLLFGIAIGLFSSLIFNVSNIGNAIIIGVFATCMWYFVAWSMLNDLTNGSAVQEFYSEEDHQQSAKVIAKKYFYHEFVNGCAIVQEITFYDTKPEQTNSSLYNFIDKEGKYISEKWYNAVSDFSDGADGAAIVYDGTMFNIIGKDGKVKSTNWFYGITEFSDGMAKVKWNDGTINFINDKGELLWREWKDEIEVEQEEDDE